MTYFDLGGQRFTTLDYDVISSTPLRSYREGSNNFEQRAQEELAESTPDDFNHRFVTIYSEYGCMYHTGIPDKVFRLGLTAQDYLYAPSIKKTSSCALTAVYHRQGSRYTLLWRNLRFQPNAQPLFLSKYLLEKKLKKIFRQVTLTLGELKQDDVPSIAWELQTEQGTFFIPWHNGCIVEEQPNLIFTPKAFKEMRFTYKILRFTNVDGENYKILCA